MKKQHIFFLILAAVLCLGLMSTGVCAGGNESVYVGNTDVFVSQYSGQYYVLDKNGNLTTSGATKNNYNAKFEGYPKDCTLTLRDFYYSGTGHSFDVWDGGKLCQARAGIDTSIGLTIKVIGDCTFDLTGTGYSFGIYEYDDDGNDDYLVIKNGENTGEFPSLNFYFEDCAGLYGIFARDNSGFSDGFDVDLNGIYLSIIGGTCSENSCLIECNNLLACDATIDLMSRDSGGDNIGISCVNDAEFEACTLYLNTGNSVYYNAATNTDNIFFTDCTAYIKGGNSEYDDTDGISCNEDVHLYRSTVDINAGEAYDDSAFSSGIYCDGDVSFTYSNVTCNASYSGNESVGISSTGNMTSDTSNVRACGGESKRASIGIQIFDDIDFTDSVVFARGDAAPESYGMGCYDSVTVNNSDVIAYAVMGSTEQKAFDYKPVLNPESGYSIFAGDNCTKAKRIASPSYNEPFMWITPKSNAVNKFKDVKENSWYGTSVLWAVAHGITAGTGDGTTFSPTAICDRAQMVTFLWNLAGKPEPISAFSDLPFKDVQNGKYYTKSLIWAYENGITSGTTATTFAPTKQLTRAEVVTFLWNFCGNPEPSGPQNPFTDLKANWYKNAVIWAAEYGITAGKTETTFAPNDLCTRAEIVSFLFRCDMVR